LLWALVASAVVHSALVALPRALPGHGSLADDDRGIVLQAALVRPPVKQGDPLPDPQPEVGLADTLSPMQLAAQDSALPPAGPPLPHGAVPPPLSPLPPRLGVGGSGDVRIDGMPLAERDRLGEMLSRQLSEFPVEVDFPVRLTETIRAKYPPAALAEGREDSVAVWIVVDAQGAPAEIVVTDGQEEFASAVVEAVRSAHFVPARNNLEPIRYPIALEFRFAIDPQTVGAGVAQ